MAQSLLRPPMMTSASASRRERGRRLRRIRRLQAARWHLFLRIWSSSAPECCDRGQGRKSITRACVWEVKHRRSARTGKRSRINLSRSGRPDPRSSYASGSGRPQQKLPTSICRDAPSAAEGSRHANEPNVEENWRTNRIAQMCGRTLHPLGARVSTPITYVPLATSRRLCGQTC